MLFDDLQIGIIIPVSSKNFGILLEDRDFKLLTTLTSLALVSAKLFFDTTGGVYKDGPEIGVARPLILSPVQFFPKNHQNFSPVLKGQKSGAVLIYAPVTLEIDLSKNAS